MFYNKMQNNCQNIERVNNFRQVFCIALIFIGAFLFIFPQTIFADSSGPFGPGTVTTDNSSGGTANWTNPDNVKIEDGASATASMGSEPWTIYDKKVRIIKGGTIGLTDKANVAAWGDLAYTTYGGASDLWDETWAASDINAGNFGFAISSYGGYGGTEPISYYLVATNFGFSIPDSATIDGITVEVKKQITGAMQVVANVDHIRITVDYTIPEHTITASAGAGGTIVPEGEVAVTEGDNQEFIITPDSQYHVADVLVDSVSVGAVESYEFTNVTQAHTIEASFAPDPVDGECGSSDGQTLDSAPDTNLCLVGTASAVSGSGPWTWTCQGENGGTTASCSADKTPEPGQNIPTTGFSGGSASPYFVRELVKQKLITLIAQAIQLLREQVLQLQGN
jgi:hypothetical protein